MCNGNMQSRGIVTEIGHYLDSALSLHQPSLACLRGGESFCMGKYQGKLFNSYIVRRSGWTLGR